MSLESLEDFLEKYRNDIKFKSAIDNAPDLQAKKRIAEQGGFSFSEEDIQKFICLEKQKELDEDDLNSVVGGTNFSGQTLWNELKVIMDIVS